MVLTPSPQNFSMGSSYVTEGANSAVNLSNWVSSAAALRRESEAGTARRRREQRRELVKLGELRYLLPEGIGGGHCPQKARTAP